MITILCGDKVTSSKPLIKVRISEIYKGIAGGSKKLTKLIKHLRIVKSINTSQYNFMKKELPFITCGIFEPKIRQKKFFAYTESFILDIDHISQKERSIDDLKELLRKDERVFLLFTSPSNDGLKVLFKLKERCYDQVRYAMFYKLFSSEFSKQYQLDQLLDDRTSDVTRACFMSFDPDAYYNPNCIPVDLKQWLPQTNTEQLFLLEQQKKELKSKKKPLSSPPLDPDEETLKKLLPGEEKVSVEVLEERIKEQIRNEKFAKLLNEELRRRETKILFLFQKD